MHVYARRLYWKRETKQWIRMAEDKSSWEGSGSKLRLNCSWVSWWTLRLPAHLSPVEVTSNKWNKRGEREQCTRWHFIETLQKERKFCKIQGATWDWREYKGKSKSVCVKFWAEQIPVRRHKTTWFSSAAGEQGQQAGDFPFQGIEQPEEGQDYKLTAARQTERTGEV